MKEIDVASDVLNKIKNGSQTQIILEDDLEIKNEMILKTSDEKIKVEITAKSYYKELNDCFKIIPIDLFGFDNVDSAIKYYRDIKKINVYRIKYDDDKIEQIDDKKMLSLIDEDSIVKNNIGFSSINVYEVNLKNGLPAILKIQNLSSRNNLEDEYERIKWLQGKSNVPKIYYFNKNGTKKYLLMEKIVGLSAHKTDGFAFKIGKFLKDFHNINIGDCEFKQNSIDNLLENALNNIDVVTAQVKEVYPDMTKNDIIKFLNENKPVDKVLVHGDYSLPNIIVDDEGKVNVIDLGDVSISSCYFDFFYLKKSLIRNKKTDKLGDVLNGYGIDKLDDNYLKWMEIVDKALY